MGEPHQRDDDSPGAGHSDSTKTLKRARRKRLGVFFTLFPKITQVCVKVNCYTILCKIDEVFTQSNVGVLTFYTMLCKNVNLYTGLCNDSISCICDQFYTDLCNFTQSCVSLHKVM